MHVVSIELAPALHEYARRRFVREPRVELVLGDSALMLAEVIAQINQPITFWLDAHHSSGITARGVTRTALEAELQAIACHPVRSHTILIDDRRCFGTVEFDYFTEAEALEILRSIRPDYEISTCDGSVADDILVARPPKEV